MSSRHSAHPIRRRRTCRRGGGQGRREKSRDSATRPRTGRIADGAVSARMCGVVAAVDGWTKGGAVPRRTPRSAIVVGAGPNGLVAANLLLDHGWDVLVLE